MQDKKIPNHLGIILDGNRRWAREKGLPAFSGHRKGADVVKKIIKAAEARGVKILTLFVFSTENWNRPKREVDYLMNLLEWAIGEYENGKEGISIRAIGLTEKLPANLRKKIIEIQKKTENNKGMILNFALSYGGRAEIVEAIKSIIKNRIPLEKINEDVIKENLWTSDVDLVIRTGKEQRLSNFLIWQSAYSEFYFSPKYWPDFTEKDLDEAFSEYSRRQRRFGN
jgi:undecaprenyl diphosphate synthase